MSDDRILGRTTRMIERVCAPSEKRYTFVMAANGKEAQRIFRLIWEKIRDDDPKSVMSSALQEVRTGSGRQIRVLCATLNCDRKFAGLDISNADLFWDHYAAETADRDTIRRIGAAWRAGQR